MEFKIMRNYKKTLAMNFSEKEIEDMLNGKDILLDAEQWCERHDQRDKWLQDEMDKLEKAALKALKPAKKPRKKKIDSEVAKSDAEADKGFKSIDEGFITPEEELMFLQTHKK